MSRELITGYTAVSANILSAPTDTKGYQPATSSSYPLQPLGQTTSQSVPLAYYSRTAHYQQQQANTVVVASTQSNTTTSVEDVRPPNYLGFSLLNLLCCCFPLGIIGLIYSLRVDSEFVAGHYAEAKRTSDAAKGINYVGLGIGAFFYITSTVVAVIYTIFAVALASEEQ